MTLSRDRWMPISEIAEIHGKSVDTIRKIAQSQNGIFRTSRYSRRTLNRWPKFSKDPSGQWGVWQSVYERAIGADRKTA